MAKIVTTVTDKGRRVTARYEGGAYVDLSFGYYRQPTEVINVWNDTLQKGIPVTLAAVRAEVREWIKSNDEEWPEWYEGYMENARYSG